MSDQLSDEAMHEWIEENISCSTDPTEAAEMTCEEIRRRAEAHIEKERREAFKAGYNTVAIISADEAYHYWREQQEGK
jgi:hypothetical protein